ncbi:UNVERIFIED_CONTAM: hypothetical protein GTU68_037165, partial [Idotea baltica]|nr:hypothetical protein [Idotea baltica]
FDQVLDYRKQYGDVFIWQIGTREVVFLCDPQIIRRAFTNPLLSDRPSGFFTFDSWSNFKKSGIVNNNGLSWQAHRRFALRNLRDSGFGTSLVENIVCMEAECLIKDFKDNFLLTPTEIPSAVNVAALNVIWKLVADIRFEREDEDLQSFHDSLTSIVSKIQGFLNFFDVYPMLAQYTPKFIMDKMGFAELQSLREDVKKYLRSIVARRKATLNKENPNGLIDSYLLEMDNNSNDQDFDEENLIILLGDLFFAGSDTTASTLRWLIQLMALNPEIQKKVQVEIDSVVPRDRLPSLADKPKLPFTDATLHESLRMAHLAPLGVFHGAREDTTIEQYFIPGTVIVSFLYACHMDTKYWDKPNTFNPAHFLDSKGNFTANTDFFMPFSTGRRSCLGESLARTELFLFGTSLIQNFSFEMSADIKNSTLEKGDGTVLFVIPPKHKIIIKERK